MKLGGVSVIIGRDLDEHFWRQSPWAPAHFRKTVTVLATQMKDEGVVSTPEGDMAFHPGDYLVTDDPPTHAWPVRREVFERTHAQVNE